MKVALLFAIVLLAACGRSSDGAPAVANAERTTCSADADCVITTFAGCCACCDGAPHALPLHIAERERNRCAAVECRACSEGVQCAEHEPEGAFVARCKEGTCVSEKR